MKMCEYVNNLFNIKLLMIMAINDMKLLDVSEKCREYNNVNYISEFYNDFHIYNELAMKVICNDVKNPYITPYLNFSWQHNFQTYITEHIANITKSSRYIILDFW